MDLWYSVYDFYTNIASHMRTIPFFSQKPESTLPMSTPITIHHVITITTISVCVYKISTSLYTMIYPNSSPSTSTSQSSTTPTKVEKKKGSWFSSWFPFTSTHSSQEEKEPNQSDQLISISPSTHKILVWYSHHLMNSSSSTFLSPNPPPIPYPITLSPSPSTNTTPKLFPPGLINTGNTCYINSIIQSISSVTSFMSFLEHRIFTHYAPISHLITSSSSSTNSSSSSRIRVPFTHEDRIDALESIYDLISRLNIITPSHTSLHPTSHITRIFRHLPTSSTRSYRYTQQDAHEFWVMVCMVVDQCCIRDVSGVGGEDGYGVSRDGNIVVCDMVVPVTPNSHRDCRRELNPTSSNTTDSTDMNEKVEKTEVKNETVKQEFKVVKGFVKSNPSLLDALFIRTITTTPPSSTSNKPTNKKQKKKIGVTGSIHINDIHASTTIPVIINTLTPFISYPRFDPVFLIPQSSSHSPSNSSLFSHISPISNRDKPEKWVTRSPFIGYTSTRIHCTTCTYTSSPSLTSFDHISLIVPTSHSYTGYSSGGSGGGIRIEDLVMTWFSGDDVDGYVCDGCSWMRIVRDIEKQRDVIMNMMKTNGSVAANVNGSVKDVGKDGELNGNGGLGVQKRNRKKKKPSQQQQQQPSPQSQPPQQPSQEQLQNKITLLSSHIITIKSHLIHSSLSTLPSTITSHYTPPRTPSPRITKHTIMYTVPRALCLHMQRSVFDPVSGRTLKNGRRVMYGEWLDMPLHDMRDGFVCDGETSDDMPQIEHVPDTPIITPPSITTSKQISTLQSLDMIRYRLCSVILHYGSHESGHFITYRRIRNPSPSPSIDTGYHDTWYRISDDSVDIVYNVHDEVYGHGSQYVYMLFYERE